MIHFPWKSLKKVITSILPPESRIFTPHFDENEPEPEESPPVESSKKHDPSDGSNSNSNSTGSDDSLGNGEYIETIERDSEFFEETNGSVKNEPDQNSDIQGVQSFFSEF